jgi:imidazolonepropionase-like amidohydrolase
MKVPFAILLACCALRPAPAQEPAIVIRARTVIDGKGAVLRNTNIVIRGSRIAAVTSSTSLPVTYDLGDLVVMPGWIDTHVHIHRHFGTDGRPAPFNEPPQQAMLYAAANAYATLMAGFTTLQSLGAGMDRDLREGTASGLLPGPRVLTSLRAINERTGDVPQIREAVRQMAKYGADVIKIFATKSIRDGGGQSLSDEQIQAACAEAKAVGLRPVVHAHAASGAKAAIRAGCGTIEHGMLIDDETIELMAQRGTYYDPTLLILHYILDNKPKFLGFGNYTEQGFSYTEKAVAQVNQVLRKALARHVKIVLGTDSDAGAHGRNAEEFIYRVRDGGQAPMDALLSATSRAAESLNLQGKIGSIAPGLEADLIATNGNPLEDITAVRRVAFVMRGGQVYKGGVVSPPSPSQR